MNLGIPILVAGVWRSPGFLDSWELHAAAHRVALCLPERERERERERNRDQEGTLFVI